MARTPKYKAAETEMIRRIKSGTWEIGKRLPNEFELADEFGVSQGTMRRALISLEGMGLLNRKPGRGTLVAANEPATPSGSSAQPASLPRIVDAHGATLEFEPFRSRTDTRRADAVEAALFGAGRLATLSRMHKVDGARAATEEVIVPQALIPKLNEAAPIDLSDCLAEHGLSVARVSADARAAITDMSLSVSLSVDRHTALLVVTTTAYDAADTPLAQQVLQIAAPGAGLTYA